MDKAKLESQLAIITQQLADIEAAEQQAARNAANAFVMEYDYTVAWPHPAQFRIERKVTADCAARLKDFSEAYGAAIAPKPFEGGMTYSLLEGGYALSGGGNVVVRFGDDKSFQPNPIAAEVVASLRNGVVPDSIKRP